jgi:hypothetical protein
MTEEQIIEAARAMRKKNWTWVHIARQLGVDREWLKERLSEPTRGRSKRGIALVRQVERDAQMRKAEIPEDRRDLTARIFGDPIFERSALYQKMMQGVRDEGKRHRLS